MPLSTMSSYDKRCSDKQINSKCLLLDIEIWQNGEKGCSDIDVGEWFIVQRKNDRWYCWSCDVHNADIVGFASAQAALDRYISNPNEFKFI